MEKDRERATDREDRKAEAMTINSVRGGGREEVHQQFEETNGTTA